MADKIDVEIGGRSKYEIAHLMAMNMLAGEQKSTKDRKAYLDAVAEAIHTLSGYRNV